VIETNSFFSVGRKVEKKIPSKHVSSSPLFFGINAYKSNCILEILSIKKIVKSSSDPSVLCECIQWKK
jgi:hypothetical protein